jgi:hypothetical protein
MTWKLTKVAIRVLAKVAKHRTHSHPIHLVEAARLNRVLRHAGLRIEALP